MKQIMTLCMALFLGLGSAYADEVSVSDVTVPQNGTGIVTINLTNPGNTYTAGQMALVLPGGVTAIMDANGDPQIIKGERMASTNHSIGASYLDNGMEQFTIFSINSSAIAGTEGALFTVNITADESLTPGMVLNGKLVNIELTTTEGARTLFNEQTFSITISEPVDPWITLDETDTAIPESATGVDVRVLRTIKANEWSTLCLPFDMTEEQVYAAFGDDVELAEYIDHEMNDAATQLTVTFDAANLTEDGLMANNPYIIKTSKDITEFKVDGVNIDADEDGAVAEYTNGRSGSRKEVYGSFHGTYHAGTIVPANSLFINSSQFWYSKGLTKMKAFRAYFTLVDVLASVENTASIKMRINVDGLETGIDKMDIGLRTMDNVFDLSGRSVKQPQQRGIYIINGKKVVLK